MLFIPGGKDMYITVQRTLEIAKEAGKPQGPEIVAIPGANHVMEIGRDRRMMGAGKKTVIFQTLTNTL